MNDLSCILQRLRNTTKKSKTFYCIHCQLSRNKSNNPNHIEEALETHGYSSQLAAGDINIDVLLDELFLGKKLENMVAAHCLSLTGLKESTRQNETSSSGIDDFLAT